MSTALCGKSCLKTCPNSLLDALLAALARGSFPGGLSRWRSLAATLPITAFIGATFKSFGFVSGLKILTVIDVKLAQPVLLLLAAIKQQIQQRMTVSSLLPTGFP